MPVDTNSKVTYIQYAARGTNEYDVHFYDNLYSYEYLCENFGQHMAISKVSEMINHPLIIGRMGKAKKGSHTATHSLTMDPKTRTYGKDWKNYSGDTFMVAADSRKISEEEIKNLISYFDKLVWLAENFDIYPPISVENYHEHLRKVDKNQISIAPAWLDSSSSTRAAHPKPRSRPQDIIPTDQGFFNHAAKDFQSKSHYWPSEIPTKQKSFISEANYPSSGSHEASANYPINSQRPSETTSTDQSFVVPSKSYYWPSEIPTKQNPSTSGENNPSSGSYRASDIYPINSNWPSETIPTDQGSFHSAIKHPQSKLHWPTNSILTNQDSVTSEANHLPSGSYEVPNTNPTYQGSSTSQVTFGHSEAVWTPTTIPYGQGPSVTRTSKPQSEMEAARSAAALKAYEGQVADLTDRTRNYQPTSSAHSQEGSSEAPHRDHGHGKKQRQRRKH